MAPNYPNLLKNALDPWNVARDLDLSVTADRIEFWEHFMIYQGHNQNPLLPLTPQLVEFLHNHACMTRPTRVRSWTESNVRQYSQDILDDNWVHGGGHVAGYDVKGRFAQGFGRVQAVTVAKRGIVVQFRFMSEDELAIIDNSKPNDSKDRIAIKFGLGRKSNAKLATNTFTVIRDYLFGRVTPWNKSSRLLQVLGDHHLDAWKDVWDSVSNSRNHIYFRQSGVLAAFVYHIADAKYRGDLEREKSLLDLWKQLINNSGLIEDTPAHSMYSRIISPRGTTRIHQVSLMQWMMHGIDAYLCDRPLKFKSMYRKTLILDVGFQSEVTRIG